MTDIRKTQWDRWRAALNKEPVPITDGDVWSGFFYQQASRGGGRIPVAVWRDPDGAFRCRYGAGPGMEEISEVEAQRRWTWFAGNPVPRTDYYHAADKMVWPCGTPVVAPERHPKGNLPDDPYEALRAEIADKMESAARWLSDHPEAKSQIECDYARNLQAELLALNKRADEMHGSEKRPVIQKGREIDARFAFRDDVKDYSRRLRDVFGAFMAAEEKRQKAEADRRHREELARVAAERERLDAERAKKLVDDPIAALTEAPPEMPELPLAPEPVRVRAGGGIGRAAGLKSVWVPEITDFRVCLAHFAEHPDVRAAVEKIVAAQVRAMKGHAQIPGVVVTENRRVT